MTAPVRTRSELGRVGAVVVAEGAARLLSFAFYIVAARALDPAEFGLVRYALALGLVATGATAVLATAVGRELGAARADPRAVPRVAGSAVAAGAGLWLLTVAALVVADAVGLLGRAPIVPLLVATTGLSILQLYYAAAGALGHVGRMVTAYAGASLLQLVALVALSVADRVDASVVLLLFGASNILLCVCLELARPMWSWRRLVPAGGAGRRLWSLSKPLAAASIGFLVWSSADQIWVEAAFDEADAGVYGAAKNLSMLFMVVPAAVRAVGMPRVAHLRAMSDDAAARALIVRLLAAATAVATAVAAAAAVAAPTVIDAAYGAGYDAADGPFLALATAMALFVVFATLVNAAVGWGRVRDASVAYAVVAGMQLALLMVAGDDPSLAYAGWASAIAIAGGLVVLAVRFLRGAGYAAETAADA